MRKLAMVAGAIALTSLSACGSSGFLNRDRPDEFAVSRQAPLVIPPDFALTPPRLGDPRPQTDGAQAQTLEAMFGGPQARSATESAVVARAGSADAGIRSSVGDAQTQTVNKGAVTRDIIAAPEGDGQNASASVPQ
ncbi:MAG: DUF3035 domain-containing protein [Parasphingorhabdus sp.]|nr:DUF3035 domain-containing protein [Parasphingorhabdus sp.]